MKILSRVSRIALVVALGVAYGQSNTALSEAEKAPSTNSADRVAAVVNGVNITGAEIKAAEAAVPQQLKDQVKDKAKFFAFLRDQIADFLLLKQQSVKENLDNDAEVQLALAKAKEQILVQAYLQKYLKTKVTQEAVRSAYDKEVKNLPKDAMETKASHILVKEENKAKSIISDLNSGKDFAKLAMEQSLDKGTAVNGGDVGYFQKNEMVPEFSEAAFALAAGEHTKEPVKTQFGYHVIRVKDRRKVKAKKLADETERLKAKLTEEAVGELIKGLRESAKIERFDMNGKPDKALSDTASPAVAPAA